MKITKLKETFKQSTVSELKEKLEAFRRDLFGLKLNASTSHVKDCSQFKKLRKNIARVSTYIQHVEHKATTIKA